MKRTLLLLAGFAAGISVFAQAPKPNIVFLLVDDLNDYVEGYEGHPQVETPNIAALSEHGTVFMNAFANSTKCMPSRLSITSGKDLSYTQVYNNVSCKPFRNFFTAGDDNADVFSIAEVLKDSAGYFTYGINKIDHCYETYADFDEDAPDDCSRGLSWNKYFEIPGPESMEVFGWAMGTGDVLAGLTYLKVPDEMETQMLDYILVDTALRFINEYDSDPSIACNKPLFMTVGFRKPHQPWFIPEHYFLEFYQDDMYEYPFSYPYNDPVNAYPYNGVKLAPQPEVPYADYYALPEENGLARVFADEEEKQATADSAFQFYTPMPEIEAGLSVEERKYVLGKSYEANTTMAYLAATKFIDAQIGRFMDSLEINNPEFYNNTVFIFTSDHGYTLGEKRNWEKGSLWDTDTRVPLVIFDARNPTTQPRYIYNVASLIDLFPTILDYGQSSYPVNADGTPYLDGNSLLPMIQYPTRKMERVALIGATAKLATLECSCFPTWSVRTDRFHYIYYTSNNDTYYTSDCHYPSSFHEEELYEVGVTRETDPEEWKNLINDPDYEKVLEYMRSFLPDSSNYKKPMYKVDLTLRTSPCLPTYGQKIKITPKLYNPDGVTLVGGALSGFTFRWTNSLTSDVYTTTNLVFPLNSIPIDVFNSNEEVIIYLEVIDNATMDVVALNIQHVYINPLNTPEIDYSLSGDGTSVTINDLSISGSYTDVSWNVVGQYLGQNPPDPFIVPAPGVYVYRCSATYGNKSTCKVVNEQTIMMPAGPPVRQAEETINDLLLQPNPASSVCMIYFSDPQASGKLIVYNNLGMPVYTTVMQPGTPVQMSTRNLASGLYTVVCSDQPDITPKQLMVIH